MYQKMAIPVMKPRISRIAPMIIIPPGFPGGRDLIP
jgi:hypothetical protein